MINPTIKDVADKAGVSIASVSRVLNNKGYASEPMRKKVLEAAEKLNYVVNDVAKSLKTNRTNTIGVLIPDIGNPFFMQISKGIEDEISNANYNILFTSGKENIKKEEELLKLLIKKRVDGIALASAGLHTNLLNNIINSNIPLVLVDRKIEGLENKADCVVENNVEGAYQLTNKLVSEGHKKIGIITGLTRVSTTIERYNGYEKLMKEYNLEIDEKYIYYGDYSEEAGKKAIEYFANLINPPTAILSFNNTMTAGASKQLMKKYLSDELKFTIASYGEIEFQNYLKNLNIYSVKQNPYKIGRLVGKIIMKKLNAPNPEFVEKKFVSLNPEYNFEV